MSKTVTKNKITYLSNEVSSKLLEILKFQFNVPKSMEFYKNERRELVEILDIAGHDNFTKNVLKDEIDSFEGHTDIVCTMSLIYGIAHFEAYFNDLTRTCLTHFWQTLKTKNKTMTYEEILAFDNLDDLKNLLIEKEVAQFSHLGIKEKIEYFENKLHVTFTYMRQKGIRLNWNCVELDDLINLFAKRNLTLHNGGIVNEIYLRICKNENYELGESIVISKDYAIQALTMLFRISDSIKQVIIKKLKK